MTDSLFGELQDGLAKSDAAIRKCWAERMTAARIPLVNLMSLLHADEKTAQRFTWFIGDVLALNPDAVVECVPMLYSLRDQMPFPGMHRTVAKCLWLTNVPEIIEEEAIEQLFAWLDNDQIEISCKHYSAHAIFDLVQQHRTDRNRFARSLERQTNNANPAHAKRMARLLERLRPA